MRKLTVSDYIVEFLISKGVTDVFGYQGGMITYIFDSLAKYKEKISYHSCATEQGASFAACGYAQASGKLGVAISTSGPGFTNLLTGMGNAWFDSIPVLFISGQVNTKDKKHDMSLRQRGFQEIQAPLIASPMVKKSYNVDNDDCIIDIMNESYTIAMNGRKGPIFIDLPINICRGIVDCVGFDNDIQMTNDRFDFSIIYHLLKSSKRPLIIAGAGINQSLTRDQFITFVHALNIPVVTTLPSVDLLATNDNNNVGYIGASGRRESNLVLRNCDLVISLGSRLSTRQVGHNFNLFAPNAQLIRIDIDNHEFERKIKENEVQYNVDLKVFFSEANNYLSDKNLKFDDWNNICQQIKNFLFEYDKNLGNDIFSKITKIFNNKSNIVLDVGKNLIWGAQSSVIKDRTRLFMSAGFGAMGYSLPSAIGIYYGNKNPTCSFNGDGGIQMNIQELNTISKNNLPIKVFVINNKVLGMITLFQDQYFEGRHIASDESINDYFTCNICQIATAYGIRAYSINSIQDINKYRNAINDNKPALFEIIIDDYDILPNIPAGQNPLEYKKINDDLINLIKKLNIF